MGLDTVFAGITGIAGALGTLIVTKHFEDNKEKRQLEQFKLQMVTENRKDSCLKVNEEINRALKTIRLNRNYEADWTPTEPGIFEETSEALTKEFPFVEKSLEQALKLFVIIMGETVSWEWEQGMDIDKDRIITRAYYELEYISEHITDFLRSQINLVNEEPSILSKIALLKLCIFISKSEFEGLKFPNQNIIKLNGAQSPIDIVQFAENNLALFKKELAHFLKFVKDPLNYKNANYLASEIAEAEKFLRDL